MVVVAVWEINGIPFNAIYTSRIENKGIKNDTASDEALFFFLKFCFYLHFECDDDDDSAVAVVVSRGGSGAIKKLTTMAGSDSLLKRLVLTMLRRGEKELVVGSRNGKNKKCSPIVTFFFSNWN